MALPMLIRCNSSRFPLVFSLNRLLIPENIALNLSAKTRLPPSSPAGVVAAVRPYSSDRGGQKQNKRVVVVGIPNIFTWFRFRVYYFLIRSYFDKEFNIEEFTEGAKQVRGKSHGVKLEIVDDQQRTEALFLSFYRSL